MLHEKLKIISSHCDNLLRSQELLQSLDLKEKQNQKIKKQQKKMHQTDTKCQQLAQGRE